MQPNTKIRVGILRGGAGEHYASSLKRGGEIITHIFENLSDKYKPVDILIDKKGVWHFSGVPIRPADLIHKIDVIWDASHSNFSTILDNISIPNIGISHFSHTLENNKEMLREHMRNIEIDMPRSIVSPKTAREVFEKFSAPWRVGDKLVKTFPELVETIGNGQNILVEEFIYGKTASIHSIANFRSEDVYVFPPGNFMLAEKEKLVKLAKNLHKHIGAKHYLKSGFVLSPRGKIYLLSVELTPDFKKDSHFSQSCELIGAKMHHVVEHILEEVL